MKLSRLAHDVRIALGAQRSNFSTLSVLYSDNNGYRRGRWNSKPNDRSNRFDDREDRRGGSSYRGKEFRRYDDRRNDRYSRPNNPKWKSKSFMNSRDDEELITRTKSTRRTDNGLMGEKDYELARGDEIKHLEWTDLIPKKEDGSENTETETPSGVSAVPTKELATKRLVSLPLVNSLIHNRKYEHLTPVQAQTLLPILKGESVVVRAKTGTGKTAAFSIPILQKVLEAKIKDPKSQHVHALIISPTRELAQQIADEIFKITQFGGMNHIKVQSLVGGLAKDRQIRAAGLDGSGNVADIIVATPGRLVDVLGETGVAKNYFHSLSARVLDEADRILDIGFEREMDVAREIIDEVSTKPEIPLLLFSATADRKMQSFARNQFGDRVKVVDTVPKNEPTANELVDQKSVACRNWVEVFEAASREITEGYEKAQEEGTHFKAIVFLPTTLLVDQYERVLRRLVGRQSPLYNTILGVHGQRSQSSRQTRADRFRRESDAVLITTDVVARGMDFPKVTHVFQLGPPADVSSYVHRIGRTARIGNNGKSFLYYTHHMRRYIDALAREGIKPKQSVYSADNEDFTEKMRDAFSFVLKDEDDAQELLSSLMGFMTVLKSKFDMNARDFLDDMKPFVEFIGLEQMNMGSQMRDAWSIKSRNPRRNGYGSSRRTRMRW